MSDLPDILELVAQARASIKTLGIDQWQRAYPGEEIFREDIALGRCHLFLSGGKPAGVMALSFRPEESYAAIEGKWPSGDVPYAVIHRMAVGGRERGGGLSVEMLRIARQLCAERGVYALRTDTHRGNLPMRRFLEKNGFVQCGEVLCDEKGVDPVRVAYELPLGR